jgi:uncharacterized damage-inducible protein DinB
VTTSPRRDVRPPDVNADERTTLLAFLDYLRATVVAKVVDVPDDLARTPGVPSGTSLAGLLKHLTAVEFNWFVWTYHGADVEQMDHAMEVAPDEHVSDLVAAYRRVTALCNEVVDGWESLDVPAARWLGPTAPRSRRWILVHMVEETARHAGHADILREQLDGLTGR